MGSMDFYENTITRTHFLPLAGGIDIRNHDSNMPEATGIVVAGVVALIWVAFSSPVAEKNIQKLTFSDIFFERFKI